MSRSLHARDFSNEALYSLNDVLGNPYLAGEQVKKKKLPQPYIGLGARLSQVWLNQWTILLLLIAIRLAIAAASFRAQMEDGRSQVQAACSALEATGSAALSLPHYLSRAANSVVATSIDASIAALSTVLEGLLTAVEALVLFFINTFKSTYICLLELAIEGSIGAVLDAVQVIGDTLNTTLVALGDDIQESITDANVAINGIAGFIEKATAFLGQKVDIPTVNIPLAKLDDFRIPTSFDQGLDKARANLNLDAVENATDAVFRYPFEQLKLLVDARFADFSFNKSLLPVPAKEQLSFCADSALDGTFDNVVDGVMETYRALLIVLVVLAVLVALSYGCLEVWQWRTLTRNAHLAVELGKQVDADPIERYLIANHPLQARVAAKLTSRAKPNRQRLVRWWLAYVTHTPAAFVLLLGIAGLLSCALQAIMLRGLLSSSADIADSAGQITQDVQALLVGKSEAWANGTNVEIGALQTQLNDDLLGWVTTGTTSVNETLNVFTDTLIGTLNLTFGGTILYNPILSVFDCLILVKIRGIESGLTWVHDKAQVQLPTVSSTTLALEDEEGKSLLAQSPGENVSRSVSSVLNKIARLWRSSIKQEAVTAGALFAVWFLLALLGLLRCLWVDAGPAWPTKWMPVRKSRIGKPMMPESRQASFSAPLAPIGLVVFAKPAQSHAANQDEKSSSRASSDGERSTSRLSEVTDLEALYFDRELAPVVERVGQVSKNQMLVSQVSDLHKSVVPVAGDEQK